MDIERRAFVAGSALVGLAGPAAATPGKNLYGLIGRMTAKPGSRDALATILAEGTAGMPGCISYIVATDPADADLIWITEVWQSREAHAASLTLPAIRAVIAKGRPMIAGMERVAETVPLMASR